MATTKPGTKRRRSKASKRSRKPRHPTCTYLQRTFHTFPQLPLRRSGNGSSSVPITDVVDLVYQDAEENGEVLGSRAKLYVMNGIETANQSGYVRVNYSTNRIRVTAKGAEMTTDIQREIADQEFESKIQEHRAFCTVVKKEIGPLKARTKEALVRKIYALESELRGPGSDSDTEASGTHSDSEDFDMDELEQGTPFSSSRPFEYAADEEMEELVAGPSSAVPRSANGSPVQKSASTDNSQAAYPSPKSLPRPHAPPFVSLSPPPSPSPGSQSFNFDDDAGLDVGNEPLHQSLQQRFEEVQTKYANIRRRLTEVEASEKSAQSEVNDLRRRLAEVEASKKCLKNELEETRARLRDGNQELKQLRAMLMNAEAQLSHLNAIQYQLAVHVAAGRSHHRAHEADLANVIEEKEVVMAFRDELIKDKHGLEQKVARLEAETMKYTIDELARADEEVLRVRRRMEELRARAA